MKSVPPAVAEVGERVEIDGGAALIVNVAEVVDVPPASVTVMLTVPEVKRSLAGTVTVSCVGVTAAAVSVLLVLPQFTVAGETKFAPLTVRVIAEAPAVADVCERLDTTGVVGLIVKVAAADVPAESDTVMLAVPASAISLAGTEAVSCPEFTRLVVSGVPFQFTTAPET